MFTVYEYSQGRGTKKAYGLENDEFDMLSPSQKFAIRTGIEKAKIIKSSNFETTEFNLDDFKHLKRDPASVKEMQEMVPEDDDDEDNVA